MLIGEVSRRSGVSARMLRHYDALGLVTPTGRTSGGYREYSPDDIRRLFHVESLRTLGLSLEDTKRALDEPEFAPSALVGDLIRTPAGGSPPNRNCSPNSSGSTTPDPRCGTTCCASSVCCTPSTPSRRAAGNRPSCPGPGGRTAGRSTGRSRAGGGEPECGGGAAVVAGACRRSGTSRIAAALGLGVGRDPSARHRRDRVGSDTRGDRTPQTGARRSGHLDPRAGRTVLGSLGDTEAIPTLMTMIVDGRSDVEAAEVLGRLAASTRIPTTSPGWCTTRSTTPTTRPRACESRRRWPRFRRNRREILVRLVADRTGPLPGPLRDPGSARPRQRATSTSALTAPRRAVRR